MQFAQLSKGQTVKICGFKDGDKTYRARLLSMGLTRGVVFSVERIAPFGCPLLINVRGTLLALRKHEANLLLLESV